MDAVEVELKFQVPAAAQAAVRRALGTATARTVRLRAAYFDTADQRLAAAAMALRLRHEGRAWVQTLKGRGDGLMQRLEHEVQLPPQRGLPALDPARHAGTPAGDALARLLADGTPLQQQYGTDIRRLLRRVRHEGAVVEIAFDVGRIVAGTQVLPVHELEFELVSGPPRGLLSLAERWLVRHGLWLDVRTKSERGHRLARGLHGVPPTRATAAVLPRGATAASALRAALQAALAQALPNMAEIVSGAGSADHLHQLRVALRRLRTALRVFAPWAADAEAARALERRWRAPFVQLGALRDDDVLAALLAGVPLPGGATPALPGLSLPAADAADAAASLREPGFSVLVLQTLQLALAVPPASTPVPVPMPALGEAVRAVLKPAWRRALAGAAGFAQATPTARHRLRRQLKRLRYAVEFLRPALRDKPAAKALAALGGALEALGVGNDLEMALRRLQALPEQTPATWFAAGWLAAQQAALQRRTRRRLRALAGLPRVWR